VGAYIFLIGISLDEYYDDGTTGTIYDGGGGSTGNGCSSGYCNSNGHCCPSYAPYYCGGSCYYTSSDALQAGGAACATHKIVC